MNDILLMREQYWMQSDVWTLGLVWCRAVLSCAEENRGGCKTNARRAQKDGRVQLAWSDMERKLDIDE